MTISDLLTSLGDPTATFTAQDILLTTLLSFVLAMGIGWVYMTTYRGASYSQSYVHTLIIMSMVVAVIMLIIGSNIARAFSLVGALSIIRFRNAMKETRDVGFIFLAMAIGMACGTRFYLVAVISTLIICALIWALYRFDLFAKETTERLLKIRLPGDIDYETVFDAAFAQYLRRSNLVAMETVQAGTLLELVYAVEMKPGSNGQEFLNALRSLNDNNKVALITGRQEVDV